MNSEFQNEDNFLERVFRLFLPTRYDNEEAFSRNFHVNAEAAPCAFLGRFKCCLIAVFTVL